MFLRIKDSVAVLAALLSGYLAYPQDPERAVSISPFACSYVLEAVFQQNHNSVGCAGAQAERACTNFNVLLHNLSCGASLQVTRRQSHDYKHFAVSLAALVLSIQLR